MSQTVSKARWKYSFAEGRKAESKFQDLMVSRGNSCIKSSKSDDIKNHVDFYVNDVPVDVKGNRHIETIWVELTNVRGDKGWLKGNSKYIVFDIVELNSFCFFDRQDLLEYTLTFTDIAKDKTEYKKRYTRKDRKDVIVKYRYDDINHLLVQCINYE
tara:strand:- start:46 stop:516 length:471 start_codon:yes stop_codon:yes gene_type:complete